MIGHRGEDFKRLYQSIHAGLQKLFGTKQPVFLSTSSAWGVMEASIRNLVERGVLIKGRPELIIENGNLILGSMRRNHISRHDVEEDLRLAAKTEDLKDIRAGYVERSGDISFIEK